MGHERRLELPTPSGAAPRTEEPPPKRRLDPGKLTGVGLDPAKVASKNRIVVIDTQ